MLGRHVQGFEIVVVVFELGALDDEETHPAEDRFDALAQQRQGMAVAEGRQTPRQGHVDAAGRRPGFRRLGEPVIELRLDRLLEIVGELAEQGPHVGGGRSERLQQARHTSTLPGEVPVADAPQRRFAGGGREIAFELGPEFVDGR